MTLAQDKKLIYNNINAQYLRTRNMAVGTGKRGQGGNILPTKKLEFKNNDILISA